MFSTTDTIVAIATPPGRGGIGVIRLSGPNACAVARALTKHDGRFEPRHATLTKVRLPSTSLRPGTPDTHTSEPPPHTAQSPAHTVRSSGHMAESYVASGLSRTSAIDQVIATYFPAPHSYTGDDVVEISAHGSPVVLQTIVSAALAAGARLAEPGEFTLRAFLNERIDLMQAEAVVDLVDAVTPLQARVAFDQLQGTLTETIAAIETSLFDLMARLEASVDFPEEGYHFVEPDAIASLVDDLRRRMASLLADARRGRLLREGLLIAIVGKPNVGKSSLFNALVGTARAIVTDVPGTTRDLVSETIDLDGLRATLVDTAGLRDAADAIEAEGVSRARRAQAVADLTIVMLDRSQPLDRNDREIVLQTSDVNRLIVLNKVDIQPAWTDDEDAGANAVPISAATGEGLDTLRARMMAALDFDARRDPPAITNARQIALVQRAHDGLTRALEATRAAGGSLSEEFVLADLQDAHAALEEITGQRATDDLLAHIFSRFCIGK